MNVTDIIKQMEGTEKERKQHKKEYITFASNITACFFSTQKHPTSTQITFDVLKFNTVDFLVEKISAEDQIVWPFIITDVFFYKTAFII